MNSLTIILSLVFIMVGISFSLLSSRTVFYVWKRYLKFNQVSEEFFFSTKKGKQENIKTIEESNTFRPIIEQDVSAGKKKDLSQSFYSEKQLIDFKKTSSEESYLTVMEDNMRYYMNAEKYRSARTLNQLKKLEEEWA